MSLFSKWRVSSASNCSKVGVFCCAEGLGICLTFCNNAVSDWIGNWGVSFGVLGVSVWIESSSVCIWLGFWGRVCLFDQSCWDKKSHNRLESFFSQVHLRLLVVEVVCNLSVYLYQYLQPLFYIRNRVLLNRAPNSIHLHPAHFSLHPAHFSLHPALCNTLNSIWTKILHLIGQFPNLGRKLKVVHFDWQLAHMVYWRC